MTDKKTSNTFLSLLKIYIDQHQPEKHGVLIKVWYDQVVNFNMEMYHRSQLRKVNPIWLEIPIFGLIIISMQNAFHLTKKQLMEGFK